MGGVEMGEAEALFVMKSEKKALAKNIILRGSLRLSRTTSGLAPPMPSVNPGVQPEDLPAVAGADLERAVAFLVDGAEGLAVALATAQEVSRLVLEHTVLWDGALKDTPEVAELAAWLASGEPGELLARDPVELAERIHYELCLAKPFPDGNARTARLMADLVLLKGGLGPALHDDRKMYCRHGHPGGGLPRVQQTTYFRRAAARGNALFSQSKAGRTAPGLGMFR